MSERRFTDLQIERVICGDLAEAEFQALATEADRQRLEDLRSESAAFLDEVGVRKQALAIAQRVEAPRSRWRFFAPMVMAAAAAAGLVLLVSRPGPEEPELATKGSALRLRVHLATDSGSRSLQDGERVPPGARLRFELTHERPGYAAVIGIDAAQLVSVYYPLEGSAAVPYDPASPVLPGAIQLEGSGGESFYGLFSASPFDARELGQRLRDQQPLPAEVQEARVELRF